MSKLVLGCIADDFTGATDLANNLVRAGMRVVQAIGVPEGPLDADVDAVVVALKSRTIAPAEAVEQFGYDTKMTHVSTGGGAFLAYVEGKKFASLEQIDD